MNKAPWICISIAGTIFAAYGCGNGGTGTTSTGHGGSTASSTGHPSTTASTGHTGTTSSTGAGGMGVGGGFGGAGGGGIACNPFTGAPCMLSAGETCDVGGNAFICYPPPNTVALCGACDDMSTFCKPGLTCIGQCTAFCCTDPDCGAGGTCDLMGATAGVGIRVAKTDGGMGAGGAGGGPNAMAACNSPAKPVSNGSCYMP